MWPFKKQIVSEEVKALAKDIEENHNNWVYRQGYDNIISSPRNAYCLVNHITNAAIRYCGSVDEIQFYDSIYSTFNNAEKKHLKISIDKCITKNAISRGVSNESIRYS